MGRVGRVGRGLRGLAYLVDVSRCTMITGDTERFLEELRNEARRAGSLATDGVLDLTSLVGDLCDEVARLKKKVSDLEYDLDEAKTDLANSGFEGRDQ
jgi:hypothetical protein